MKSSRKHAKHNKAGIPKKQLKQLLKTLPSISETQLQRIRPHVGAQTYKKLKRLTGFISQDIIDDLKKDIGSFAQMAGELAMDSDIRFSDLEEDKGSKS